MKNNVNCLHQTVCTQLGEGNHCPKKCREYLPDYDLMKLMADHMARQYGLPIPYDMIVGYSNIHGDRGLMVWRDYR